MTKAKRYLKLLLWDSLSLEENQRIRCDYNTTELFFMYDRGESIFYPNIQCKMYLIIVKSHFRHLTQKFTNSKMICWIKYISRKFV